MSRLDIRNIVVALGVAIAGTGFAEASGPGHKSKGGGNSKSCVTVTETELEVKLAGAGAQAAAKGRAESKVITVTNTATSVSTTNAFLAINAKGLVLDDGAVVTFQLNGNTVGTGSVKGRQVKLRLSTRKGDTVPTVNPGDVLTVVDPDGTTVDMTGTAGASQSETESSGN